MFPLRINWEDDHIKRSVLSEVLNAQFCILDCVSSTQHHSSDSQFQGTCGIKKRGSPYLATVHITEHVLMQARGAYCGQITLTPIVDVRQSAEYRTTWIPLTIHQEIVMSSMGTRTNIFVFICGTHARTGGLSGKSI